MRRRSLDEPVGLSVLDLVCGLFGLLVVLYAITDRVNGQAGVTSADLNFVRVEIEDQENINVGIELTVGGQPFKSWPDCEDVGPVRWGSCQPGIVEALIESDLKLEVVGITLLSHGSDHMVGNKDKKAVLLTKDMTVLCVLRFRQGFRASITLTGPVESGECKEV